MSSAGAAGGVYIFKHQIGAWTHNETIAFRDPIAPFSSFGSSMAFNEGCP